MGAILIRDQHSTSTTKAECIANMKLAMDAAFALRQS